MPLATLHAFNTKSFAKRLSSRLMTRSFGIMYWYMEHEAREHLNTCLTFGLFGFKLRSLRSNRFVVRVSETLGMAGLPWWAIPYVRI
jgi:hypothetical protein